MVPNRCQDDYCLPESIMSLNARPSCLHTYLHRYLYLLIYLSIYLERGIFLVFYIGGKLIQHSEQVQRSDYGETFYRICILSIILSCHTIIVHVFLAVDLQQAVIHVMSSYTLIISLENFPSILNIGDNSMVRSKTITFSVDRETHIW